MRSEPAPSDRAACTYSRLLSTATMARTPLATNGQPTRTKIHDTSRNTVDAGSTSGNTARSTSTT